MPRPANTDQPALLGIAGCLDKGIRGAHVRFELRDPPLLPHEDEAMTEPLITFVRLPEVPILEVLDVLNEPRNGRHLPLAGERFSETSAAEWVAAKDGQWKVHGYGPWAVRVDGEFGA